MDAFDVSDETRTMPGGCAFVADCEGELLHSYCFGRQWLGPDAPRTSLSNTAYLASAGKFIAHIAVLQLADRGLLDLDEEVYRLLPELEDLPIIAPATSSSSSEYVLHPRRQAMTIRHMLTHSSGIAGDGNHLIEAWRTTTSIEWPPGTHGLVRMFAVPLLFEPGEGWEYGHSIHLLQLLIQRASTLNFVEYVQKHVFNPLNMSSCAYRGREPPHSQENLLQAVQRDENGNLVPAPPGALNGLVCNAKDLQTVLTDLISPTSQLLSRKSIANFFAPAFANESHSLQDLQTKTDDYAAPAGLPLGMKSPPVNFTCSGGLFVEAALPSFPVGTLTWNGMPNIIWALHREKGLSMALITQLLPEDDEAVTARALEYFHRAWARFG